MKNRIIAILILALVMLSILTACGGSSAAPGSTSSSAGSSTGGGSSGSASSSSQSSWAADGSYYANETAGDGFYSAENDVSVENAVPADRKVIRNASLEIMAKDAASLYRDIVNFGVEIGGYEYSYSMANYESYSAIRAVFKIPPESLGMFVTFVGEKGNITNSTMGSEDITENYFDAKTRLETKRRSLEQYYQLLKNASGVEEIVYVQRIIDSITEDIESLEGRLNVWNSQVNMATVTLNIHQENDPIQIRKEISWNTLSVDDMGYLIKRGFFSVTNTMVSILQWIVVLIVGYSPLWVLLAVGVFLWFVVRKRMQNKEKQ